MSAPASKPKPTHFWTAKRKKALGDWLAPVIVWVTVTGFLLALLAALLGERS